MSFVRKVYALFFAATLFMGAQAVRLVPGINLLALFAFTTLTGVVISPLIAIYTQLNPASIWQAGLMTVGIFGGLTAYVFIPKKDFSFMRGMVVTGLIVVFLAGVLNLFIVGSSALSFGISCAALLLFSGSCSTTRRTSFNTTARTSTSRARLPSTSTPSTSSSRSYAYSTPVGDEEAVSC
jgi:modulator of FtsH protease